MDAMLLPFAQRQEIINSLKEEYPEGTLVELVEMNDSHTSITVGTKGKVRLIDDLATIHVNWENGSVLGIVYGVDKIKKVDKNVILPVSVRIETVNTDTVNTLLDLPAQDVYFSRDIHTYEDKYPEFKIVFILSGEEIVGYTLFDIVKAEFLSYHDDYEDVSTYLEEDKSYLYIPYLNILTPHQKNGYGTFALNVLKEQYPNTEILVYTTEESSEFWMAKGFKEKEGSYYWYHFITS